MPQDNINDIAPVQAHLAKAHEDRIKARMATLYSDDAGLIQTHVNNETSQLIFFDRYGNSLWETIPKLDNISAPFHVELYCATNINGHILADLTDSGDLDEGNRNIDALFAQTEEAAKQSKEFQIAAGRIIAKMGTSEDSSYRVQYMPKNPLYIACKNTPGI